MSSRVDLDQVDHLVWSTPDLDAGIARFKRLTGITAAAGGSHPGFGTRNALVSLGPRSYLEIVAPDPEQTGYRSPRNFRVDQVEQPTLVTWAAGSGEVNSLANRGFPDGQALGESITMSRTRPDGVELNWELTDPYTLVDDGLVPFFIDWRDSPHPGESAPGGVTLDELRLVHPDPASVTSRLQQVEIQLPVRRNAAPGMIAILNTPAGRVELS